MSVERGVRFDLIARLCPNASGAELRSVCTEAGMFAIRARRRVATEKDFLESVEKVRFDLPCCFPAAWMLTEARSGHSGGTKVLEYGLVSAVSVVLILHCHTKNASPLSSAEQWRELPLPFCR
jgi:hypothetical protein